MVKPAHTELGSARKDEGGAHLSGFASKGAFDGLLDCWEPASSGLQSNVHETGDKLVSTASTYVSTDNASLDFFQYVPWPYINGHPEPR